ncbi:hemolysin family protein [Clostridium sp. Marseille-P299]|uniref:hemolysin family protein n=1 Tax=Clostridium sp. Marseille-P299 TaxID=1805477 RepID=UPI0008338134|nr:hemolysin family protein [Clostridium sp. Marseille-P299]
MEDDSILWKIILQVILILLNAIFACAEIAIISMNDNKLSKLASQGDKRAIRLATLTRQPARFLATIQVAITLSGFLGSAFAADNFSDRLVNFLVESGVKIPVSTLNSISVVFITLILSYFTLVFGELVPKRIAMKKAETLALAMSALITFISKLFAPIVWFLTASTNTLLRLLGIDPNEEDEEVTEEEIRMMVDAGSEKGTIDYVEKEMIQNIFEFDDLTVGEICTHRTEVSLLWTDESIEQWENTIHQSRHSLYPVCNESVDDIVGVLNAKDYFRLNEKTYDSIMEAAVRPAYFVPETIKADVLFRAMKKSRNYFAVVLDEYGGMSGIVTMNDLVQQLVGEIDDEDMIERELKIENIDSQTWNILGNTPLEEVEEQLNVSLPTDEYDTFGGFIFGTLGTIPDDGSQFEIEVNGLTIKVIEVKDHRVEKAVVCLTKNDVIK